MDLPNPSNITITVGVNNLKGHGFNNIKDDYLFETALQNVVATQFYREPDQDLTGGTDKFFFTFTWRGTKFFAVANEINGLTVMLPEEY